MDLIAADWGTSRLRAYRIAGGRVAARAESEEGVSRLEPGAHAAAFRRLAGEWLDAAPDLPVLLVGMVGSREGWAMAPYAACPAGAEEIAAALMPVDLGNGRMARIVPGLSTIPRPGAADVMRGEETLCLGAGVTDGLICLPGTHSKWVRMEGGRIAGFASFMTGELYGLLRHHAMVGRPATEPADEAGFALGLAAVAAHRAEGLSHLAFAARAAVLTGALPASRLGPYLSGLVVGEEILGAQALFGNAPPVLVADARQAALYREALASRGITPRLVSPEDALVAGLARIAGALI